MDKVKEEELLTKAQEGDMEAFALVFEEYRSMCYAVAYRVAGPNDADDIVMETFLKSWRAIPRFSRRSTLKTWLYRITHNCSLDFLRKRNRRKDRVMSMDENDERTIDDLEDTKQKRPGDAIVKEETNSMLRDAMMQLDETHRTILAMRFTDELSYSDIAEVLDISIGTVMSRLFNAKRKLKKIVKKMNQ